MPRIRRDQLRSPAAFVASAMEVWPLVLLFLLMHFEGYGTRETQILDLGLGGAVALLIGGLILLQPRLRTLGTVVSLVGIAAASPIVILLIWVSGNIPLGLMYFSPNVIALAFLAYVLSGPDDDSLWREAATGRRRKE